MNAEQQDARRLAVEIRPGRCLLIGVALCLTVSLAGVSCTMGERTPRGSVDDSSGRRVPDIRQAFNGRYQAVFRVSEDGSTEDAHVAVYARDGQKLFGALLENSVVDRLFLTGDTLYVVAYQEERRASESKGVVFRVDISRERIVRVPELERHLARGRDERKDLFFSPLSATLVGDGGVLRVIDLDTYSVTRTVRVPPHVRVSEVVGWTSEDEALIVGQTYRGEFDEYAPWNLGSIHVETGRVRWLTDLPSESELSDAGMSEGYAYATYDHLAGARGICVVNTISGEISLFESTRYIYPLYVDSRGVLYYSNAGSSRILSRKVESMHEGRRDL